MERTRVVPEIGTRKTGRPATKSEDLIQRDEAVVLGNSIASGDKYCSRCQALDLKQVFDDSPLPTDIFGFLQPKRIMCIGHLEADDENSPCPVCRFFASSRLDWPPFKHGGLYYLWKLSWNSKISKYLIKSAASSRPRHVLVVALSSHCIEDFAFLSDYSKHNGLLAPLEPALRSHEVSSRKRLDYVDFGLVRSWISDCNDHHHCCRQLEPFEAVTVPIQLMDCNTAKLHTVSSYTKYAALSYVWGNEIAQTKSEGFTSSPHNLPWLIEDAMTATKSLGLQYLWVDRYCITDQEPSLKHEQIKQMDLVYGRAEITLVGLGDDPTSRLAGVNICRTKSQLSLNIEGREIMSTMRPPGITIQESKWWTRAWTFQEAALSRRRLYFTQDQVHFECRLMHHCETIVSWYIQPEVVDECHGPWGSMITSLDLGFSLFNLEDLLTLYFGRDMTYKTDVVNAFSGILRLFERHSRIRHYFGLPFIVEQQLSILHSLLWTAQFPTRKPEFPSWSWTGWQGKNLRWPRSYTHKTLELSNAQVWIERQDRSIQNLIDFQDEGGFDLPLSSQSPYIWIYAPTAQLKFVSSVGKLVSTPTECNQDWLSTASVVTWGTSNANESCSLDIEKDRFPGQQELEAYKSFMVVQIGQSFFNSMLLIVGDSDGKKERIGVARLGNYKDPYQGASRPIKEKNGILKGTNLGSRNQVVWTNQCIRLG